MALAKFDFTHKREWSDGIKFNTLVTQMDGGKEQRREKSPPRRFFIMQFEKSTISNNDAQYIYDFFVARRGKLESFLWDYKKSDGSIEEVKVRFDQDALEREAFLNLVYRFGLKMIEVL